MAAGTARALRHGRHEIGMADDLLLKSRRILGTQHAAQREAHRPQPARPRIRLAQLLKTILKWLAEPAEMTPELEFLVGAAGLEPATPRL